MDTTHYDKLPMLSTWEMRWHADATIEVGSLNNIHLMAPPPWIDPTFYHYEHMFAPRECFNISDSCSIMGIILLHACGHSFVNLYDKVSSHSTSKCEVECTAATMLGSPHAVDLLVMKRQNVASNGFGHLGFIWDGRNQNQNRTSFLRAGGTEEYLNTCT